MPVQKNPLKPYSEVITGSIIYGTIGVFLDKIQDMSTGSILFSRLFFGLCMIFIYLLFNRGLGQLKPHKKKDILSSWVF
jgi:EamA domain-containing membrane protein RarD